jgi:hypothetical protein
MKLDLTEGPAQAIYAWAFRPGREKRSDEYKRGVLNHLKNRLEQTELVCPFEAGTAQFDAYYSGCDEGRVLAAEWLRDGRVGGILGVAA